MNDRLVGHSLLQVNPELMDVCELKQDQAGHMVEVPADILDGELTPPTDLAAGSLKVLFLLFLFFPVRTNVTNQILIEVDLLDAVTTLMETCVAYITVYYFIACFIFGTEANFAISLEEFSGGDRFFKVLRLLALPDIRGRSREVFPCFVRVAMPEIREGFTMD